MGARGELASLVLGTAGESGQLSTDRRKGCIWVGMSLYHVARNLNSTHTLPSFCFRLFLFFKLVQAIPMVSRVIPVSASNTSPLFFLFRFGFCCCLLACSFWFCSYEYIHKCLLCAFTNLCFLWKLDELVPEEKKFFFFLQAPTPHTYRGKFSEETVNPGLMYAKEVRSKIMQARNAGREVTGGTVSVTSLAFCEWNCMGTMLWDMGTMLWDM